MTSTHIGFSKSTEGGVIPLCNEYVQDRPINRFPIDFWLVKFFALSVTHSLEDIVLVKRFIFPSA